MPTLNLKPTHKPVRAYYESLREHDRIALTTDLPEYALKIGDVGTIVHIYPRSVAYEVEFLSDGNTAIATVLPTQARPAPKPPKPPKPPKAPKGMSGVQLATTRSKERTKNANAQSQTRTN